MADEFYTWASLGTLAGATGATVAVTNALRSAFNLDPKWLGLLIAEIICIGVWAATGTPHEGDWFIAVLNGFLVFATAAGATAVGGAAAGDERSGATQGAAALPARAATESAGQPSPLKQGFWSTWF